MWIQIFLKELRELRRDKRARSAAIFGPFLSVALSLLLFGVVGSSVKKASQPTIHLAGAVTANNPFVLALQKANFPTKAVPDLPAGEALLRDGKAQLVLSFPEDPVAALQAGKSATIEARYDPNEQRSQIALAAVDKIAGLVNDGVVRTTLQAKGISPDAATPLKIVAKEVTLAGKTNDLLVSLVPYLVVIWAFYGGFSMASDVVAGEKERQTLETLLVTPVSRRAVALGKLAALVLLCVVSSLMAVAALAIFAAVNLPITRAVFSQGFSITPTAILVAVVSVVPLAAMFGAVLLALSTFARNTREAQTYLAQASVLVLVPAVFSQVIGLTDAASARWVYAVPVLNVTATIRSALLGRVVLTDVLLTVGISLALAAVALVVAVRLFGREGVLTRI